MHFFGEKFAEKEFFFLQDLADQGRLSLLTSLQTCTDSNRSISDNKVRAAVPWFEVLEL